MAPNDRWGEVNRRGDRRCRARVADAVVRNGPNRDPLGTRAGPLGEACYLTVLPLTRTGDVSPEPPPKPLFRYIDDSRTGIHEIDSMNVYVGFKRLQELLKNELGQC